MEYGGEKYCDSCGKHLNGVIQTSNGQFDWECIMTGKDKDDTISVPPVNSIDNILSKQRKSSNWIRRAEKTYDAGRSIFQ